MKMFFLVMLFLMASTNLAAQSLPNGGKVSGALAVGETAVYTFYANQGEGVTLTLLDAALLGGTNAAFIPQLLIFQPDGALWLSTWNGSTAQHVYQTAPVTGTYTVHAKDRDATDPGTYDLYFARAPGANNGGLLLSGSDPVFSNLALAEVKSYTFYAEKNDTVMLTLADLDGTSMIPQLLVFRPDGTPWQSTWDGDAAQRVNLVIPDSGMYTVVIKDRDATSGGSVALDYTRAAGANEGGALVNGMPFLPGNLTKGDLDSYSFYAVEGDTVSLTLTDIDGSASFIPQMTLYEPSGIVWHTGWDSITEQQINRVIPATGPYTVVVKDRDADSAHLYNISYTCVGTCSGNYSAQFVAGLGDYPGSGGYIESLSSSAPYSNVSWLNVPWGAYNAAKGETRPAVCDLDGNGLPDLVVGLGIGAGGYISIRRDTGVWGWIRIPWPTYNAANGETYVACGDIDADGKDEVVAGLGTGGGGYAYAFDDIDAGFVPVFGGWIYAVSSGWSGYSSANGAIHPAIGNLDDDSREEIVFGTGEQGLRYYAVVDDALTGFTFLRWQRAGDTKSIALNSHNVWPAICDGSIVLGASSSAGAGGQGWINLQKSNGMPLSPGWIRVPWTAYNTTVGATYPACGDLDGDAKDEIVAGLGSHPPGGFMAAFDDISRGAPFQNWPRVHWSAYNSAVGSTRPAIQ